MSVWVCVPSARPVPEVLAWMDRWKERGYQVALWRDRGDGLCGRAHHYLTGPYPGYSVATNTLIADVLRIDPSCDWVVATGDDTDPDACHTAAEIAAQCSGFFKVWNEHHKVIQYDGYEVASSKPERATFGCMQPTGDRFAEGSIDRICGSPWLGREFCRRINQGRGPFWPEYTHCFADEEMQNVAIKLGILWQRRDLIHYHHHYTRVPGRDIGQAKAIPPHLVEATSAAHWAKYKALFLQRQKAGFPGSEPIA